MDRRHLLYVALAATVAIAPSPASAQSAQTLLISAGFQTSDRTTALARIEAALKAADAAVAHNFKDSDARLQRAMAMSYRGKLTRDRGDLIASRRAFEAIVAADARDAEAQLAFAGWHLGAVIELGPLLARTALGARKATGLHALERALALGGDRALFPAFASLIRIQIDPGDVAGARRLAELAQRRKAVTAFDRIMQRQAATLLPTLRTGNGKAAARAAKLLLPFGRVR